MKNINYVKPEKLSLKEHPELNEAWLQTLIAEDPSLLGLGDDLILKDKERRHPHAGRLDLLFQAAEANQRYEVEIQLGKTDESHIIRTLEYWDIERKRYPQYEHTAVIVAENITGRFLNVISLFNGAIPLIAIQMQVVKIGDQVSLVFTTVLSQIHLGLVDDDEEVREVTDRSYWEKRGSKKSIEMADQLLEILKSWDSDLAFKYTKFYIGLMKDGQPNHFVKFRPKKDWLRLEIKLDRSEEIQLKLEEAGLDIMPYEPRENSYRIRLAKDDIKKHQALLNDLLKMAYEEGGE